MRHSGYHTVFRDMFSKKKYLIQMYKALHPEDSTITKADLKIITLQSILLNGIYNDLGFMVRGNQLMILVEAQSTWSPNIVIRALSHLVNEAVIVIGQREKRTLDALDTVGIDVPVLIRVCVALVLADDAIEDTRHKILICRRCQVSLLVIDIAFQITRLDFLRVRLCLLARAHTRAARRTADDILHRVRVDIVNDFADEHILARLSKVHP